jgi:hypothetical protein
LPYLFLSLHQFFIMPTDSEKDVEHQRPKSESDVSDTHKVDWGLDDGDNPKNFVFRKKVWITFQLGMLAMSASLGSSIITPGQNAFAEYIGVGADVAVLSVSLYMYALAS